MARALGVSGAGNIADVLYGASLIPNFQFFDTSYQALTGTLPDISLPNMQVLDLSNNYLSVRQRPLCSCVHALALLSLRSTPLQSCSVHPGTAPQPVWSPSMPAATGCSRQQRTHRDGA